mgnify:CR=1 FL=1
MFSVEVKKIDPVKREAVIKEVYEVIAVLVCSHNKYFIRPILNWKRPWKKKNEETRWQISRISS